MIQLDYEQSIALIEITLYFAILLGAFILKVLNVA